jgi:putative peptide zinc metalloprotease protein
VTPPLDTTSSTSTHVGVGADGGPAVGAGTAPTAWGDATTRPPTPTLAAGVELFGETPGSGYREPPSLVRRADGQTIQLTPLLYEVLRAVDGQRDHHQLAALVSERIGRTASAADVLFLIEAKLRPLGLLRNPDGSDPELPRANPLLALRCRAVITKPELTRRITRPFATLFRPSIVAFFLAAFAWTAWWVLFEQGLMSGFHQAFYEPHLLLLVFALTLVSAGFHEFGHAAACRYGGATPGAMGFGLYLIWPAFYTDVTDSYRLGRAGRLRVDLGGLYFNAVFAVGTFAVWSWLRADALLLLIFAQVLQMARQLAPLVRFDGYHILADLIGVPDLFAHMKPTLLGLLPSRWRTGRHQALKPWARVAITAWVLVVLPLLLVMLATIVLILPRLAATAWDSLGIQWEVLGRNWAAGEFANVGVRLLSIVSLALPVLTVSYLIARVVRRTARWAWRATADNPLKRAAAGAGAVAVVVAVALAWWPQGQFTPIDADERGGLPELFSFTAPPAELVRATSQQDPAAAPAAPTAAPAAPAADVPPPRLVPSPPQGTVGPPQLALVAVPASERSSARSTATTSTTSSTQVVRVTSPDEVATGQWEPPSSGTGEDVGSDWPFPWHAPPPAADGDNRAIVVNTEDGSTVYDLAFAFVWVTDGGPVEHRNEAFSYASCRDCKSVAVAFQVIMIVGQADVITPINTSVAANFDCESCTTHALAVQLIATLREAPNDELLSELGRIWAGLEQLEQYAELLTLEQIYTWLRHTEAQIMAALADAGALGGASSAADVAAEDQLGPAETGDEVPPSRAGSDDGPDGSVGAATEEPTSSDAEPERHDAGASAAADGGADGDAIERPAGGSAGGATPDGSTSSSASTTAGDTGGDGGATGTDDPSPPAPTPTPTTAATEPEGHDLDPDDGTDVGPGDDEDADTADDVGESSGSPSP